jgi:dephospho-CoA kinase
MIKIGVTGSIASGKTTASKLLSKKRGRLFSADKIVKELYKKKSFKSLVAKKLGLSLKTDFKKRLVLQILQKKTTLKKLEKIIHPLVRREMFLFLRKNKSSKILFFEIPLLVESKLMGYFDTVIFIKAKKRLRLVRYNNKYGNPKLFFRLDQQQIKDSKKAKLCDHIVVNNGTLKVLKKKLFNIIKLYD